MSSIDFRDPTRILHKARSTTTVCLHEVSGEPYSDRVGDVLAMSGGISMTTVHPEPSLVITRVLSSEMKTQMYVPARVLAGILPSCLVDVFFCQGEDDNINGHERSKGDAANDAGPFTVSESSARLKIWIICGNDTDNSGFCNSSAEAFIQRCAVLDSVEESDNLDKNRHTLTLLIVATAPT